MAQYQHKTSFYQEGRLGYAKKAAELITGIVPSHAAIADMGSGTGIFSASLLQKGYTIYGVEPDAALQEKAVENLLHFGRFQAVTASAEDTGLPEHSVDGITAASAFHWFDPVTFLRECKRIIKPGGSVFLLYNVRQTGDSFSRKQERICRRYCPGFSGFHHGADKAKDRLPAFFSGGYEEKRYAHDLLYTDEQFLSRCLSSSYSLDQSHLDYTAYRRELEQLIAMYSAAGRIAVGNHTAVWYGRVK